MGSLLLEIFIWMVTGFFGFFIASLLIFCLVDKLVVNKSKPIQAAAFICTTLLLVWSLIFLYG